MIRQLLVVLLGLLACCVAPAGYPQDRPAEAGNAGAMVDAWTRFTGVWQPAPGTTPEIERAVQQATADMGFLVAQIARSRLLARCAPPRVLRMRVTRHDFVIEFAAIETHVMPLSGVPVEQAGRTLSVQFERGVLVHRGSTSEGTRVNRFDLDSSGRVLTMDTTVTSPRLPKPVRFHVRLTRAGA